MTYVSTPRTGALPKQKSSKRFGRMAAAVAVVVAAGAAIATGIAVNQTDPTPATQSIYTDQLELLRAEAWDLSGGQAIQNRADQVHLGRAPAIGAQSLNRAEATQNLVNRGLIPAATLEPSVNPADRGMVQRAEAANTAGSTLVDSSEQSSGEVFGTPEVNTFVEQPNGPK